MANKIILKKSSETSKVPQANVIDAGELAINLTDKVLYSKDTANTVFLVKADPLYNTGLQDNLDAKVDISGDTMTGDLTVQGTVTVDHLQLNTSANNTAGIGEVFWNAAERTYNLGLGNDVVGQGFQEIYHPLVKNNTANTISNGTVVGVTGVDSGYVTVAPYISDGSFGHPTRYWGVATEDIISGSTGFITHFGKVRGIDTSAWGVGNILYASDSVAGMLTNIMPETPSDIVIVGMVTEVSTEGVIEVRHEFASRAVDIPYSNTDSTLIASNVKSALDELDMKKASVDMLTSSINIYPTSASGDFGYYRMVSDIDDPDYNDTAYEFQTGYITTTNQYIAGLIADANLFVGNPGVISITTVGNIAKTNGFSNDYAEFFFRLYKRDSGGTETLLMTSSTTGAVNGDINDYRQFSSSGLLNDGTFTETDRLVLKLYANMLDDNDSRYKFQFGGSNPVRTLLPVPISVIPSYHADSILVDTTNFVSILDETDDDVQTALENIDLKAAPLASPTFTGTPIAPTAASNTSTTQIATTAFTHNVVNIHTANTSNPHSVTASQVGLGNVTNESKATMFTNPTFTGNTTIANVNITTAYSTSLVTNLNADLLDGQDGTYYTANSTFTTHTANTSNPHSVTATQVGLGNVDNTSDNAKNVLSATKLTTARTIGLSGDVAGSVSFDGTANVSITTTVADDSHNHIISNVDGLQDALDLKAPLASPSFTGVPVAPTAVSGTNTTQLATTAFVESRGIAAEDFALALSIAL